MVTPHEKMVRLVVRRPFRACGNDTIAARISTLHPVGHSMPPLPITGTGPTAPADTAQATVTAVLLPTGVAA